MTTPPLSTEQGLKAYLDSHSISHTSITLLTGGTANFVYRVTLSAGKSVIYKHAAPYLHSNTSFAFDPRRMDYEDRALEILPPLLSKQHPDSSVHAVKWYSYDKSAKLLCIEDGGEQNLKDAYPDPKLDITTIGTEAGKWLAALHLCSRSTSLSLSDPPEPRGNNPIGVYIYRHSYRNLHSALSKFGHDAKFGERINEEYGSKLATDDECVCHGDFWPGNLLVKSTDSGNNNTNIAVVDWEMVRRGTSATDVGQFAAEAFLLDRFRGGRGFLPVFLDAYLGAREGGGSGVDAVWVKRMAVHWAVHVAFWPTRVEWTDEEGTQKLVDIGVGVLEAVVGDDMERLGTAELFRGVGDAWKKVLGIS